MKETNDAFEEIIADKIAAPVTIVTASKLYQMVFNGSTFIKNMPEAEVRVNRDRSILMTWKHADYNIQIAVEPDPKPEPGDGGIFNEECNYVQRATDAHTVVLMVREGLKDYKMASGFTVQSIDPGVRVWLPMLLRSVAEDIEKQNRAQNLEKIH